MDSTHQTAEVRPHATLGHLSVHVDGVSTVETPFLFEQQEKRIAPSLVASLATHGLMFAAIVLMLSSVPMVPPQRRSFRISRTATSSG